MKKTIVLMLCALVGCVDAGDVVDTDEMVCPVEMGEDYEAACAMECEEHRPPQEYTDAAEMCHSVAEGCFDAGRAACEREYDQCKNVRNENCTAVTPNDCVCRDAMGECEADLSRPGGCFDMQSECMSPYEDLWDGGLTLTSCFADCFEACSGND